MATATATATENGIEIRKIEHITAAFTSVPVLDLSLAKSPVTKPEFLSKLRDALVMVGFFYLKNTSIPATVEKSFVERSKAFLDLPTEKKLEIDMINNHREMVDFLTPLPAPGPDQPVYLNVQGPNQWPDESAVPGFRCALETYLTAVGRLGDAMKILVAEALDLESTALLKFFNDPPRNKVSLLKYPPPRSQLHSTDGVEGTASDSQGVGPHKDGGFLTFLLQATPHACLEAQNKSGMWIPVPPIPDTLVVNVGRSLESMTGGVCTAATHRAMLRYENFVDSKGNFLGPRFSFPVFQTLKLDLTSADLSSLKLPSHIADLVKDEKVKSDAEAFFAKYHLQSPGKGIFTARLTSHPDVGRRWYPQELQQALKGQQEFRS